METSRPLKRTRSQKRDLTRMLEFMVVHVQEGNTSSGLTALVEPQKLQRKSMACGERSQASRTWISTVSGGSISC